jgi:hypothetical protein
MDAILFFGALIILTALIYGTLRRHHRNKYKDHIADQIVRDRFDHPS